MPGTNYVMFNSAQKIYKYGDETDILKEFFDQRQGLYSMRKQYMLARLSKEYEILVNKVNFIRAVNSETLKINRVKRKVLIKAMIDM